MSRLALHFDATDTRRAPAHEVPAQAQAPAQQAAAQQAAADTDVELTAAARVQQGTDPATRFGASMTLSALLAACAAALLLQGPSSIRGGFGAAAAACVVAVVCLQVAARRRALRELAREGEHGGAPPEQARERAKATLDAWMG